MESSTYHIEKSIQNDFSSTNIEEPEPNTGNLDGVVHPKTEDIEEQENFENDVNARIETKPVLKNTDDIEEQEHSVNDGNAQTETKPAHKDTEDIETQDNFENEGNSQTETKSFVENTKKIERSFSTERHTLLMNFNIEDVLDSKSDLLENHQTQREERMKDKDKKKSIRIRLMISIFLFWLIVAVLLSWLLLTIGRQEDYENSSPIIIVNDYTFIFSSSSENEIQPGSISLSSDGKRVGIPMYNNEGKWVVINELNEIEPIVDIAKIEDNNEVDYEYPIALSGNGRVLAYGQGNFPSSSVVVLNYGDDSLLDNWFKKEFKTEITDFESNSTYLAISLSHSGDVIAIGDSMISNDGGLVSIYAMNEIRKIYNDTSYFNTSNDTNVKSSDDWYLMKTIRGSPGERFGNSVSLDASGSTMAVGSFKSDDIGAVRIYNYSGLNDTWSQLGNTLKGSVANSFFGISVSVSSLNKRIAIGANGFELDNMKNIGQCQMYQYLNNKWSKIGNSIIGDSPNAELGYQVSLSGDGNRVAVSLKEPAWIVRVYQFLDGDWQQIGNDFNENITEYGISIDLNLDGSILAVGANLKNGTVFIYDIDIDINTE